MEASVGDSKMRHAQFAAPSAGDCYRFVLSHPAVDVCMVGARNLPQMRENLAVLDRGPMDEEDMARMRSIGDHVYVA